MCVFLIPLMTFRYITKIIELYDNCNMMIMRPIQFKITVIPVTKFDCRVLLIIYKQISSMIKY